MTHLDSHYQIGDSHDVCQDYVLHQKIQFLNINTKNPNDEFNLIILCDGCSSSHNRTKCVDFGVRLLAWETKKILVDMLPFYFRQKAFENLHYWDDEYKRNFSTWFIERLQRACSKILEDYNMPQGSMDATVLVAVEYQGTVLSFVLGDGVLFLKNVQGDVKYYPTIFNSNAPFYPSYLFCEGMFNINDQNIDRFWSYLEEFGENSVTRHTYSLDEKLISHFFFPNDFEKGNVSCLDIYADFMASQIMIHTDLEFIGLSSDGVESFENAEKQGIEGHKMIQTMFDYKNFNGEFVKRKIKFQSKQWEKKDIVHHDDISFATMKFNG